MKRFFGFVMALVLACPALVAAQDVDVSTIAPEQAPMLPALEDCLAREDSVSCAGVGVPACLEFRADATDAGLAVCTVQEMLLFETIIAAQVAALHLVPTDQIPAHEDAHPYDLAAEMLGNYANLLCEATTYALPSYTSETRARYFTCRRDVFANHSRILAGFLDG